VSRFSGVHLKPEELRLFSGGTKGFSCSSIHTGSNSTSERLRSQEMTEVRWGFECSNGKEGRCGLAKSVPL